MASVKTTTKLLAASLAGLITTSAFAAPYDVIDLGTLGGLKNFASDVNNINEVVGNADGNGLNSDQITDENPGVTCVINNTAFSIREFCDHAYLFRNDTLIDLGVINVDGSFATSINDQSIVVGYAAEELDDGDDETINIIRERGFISYDGGPIEALPLPPEAANLPDTITAQMRALHISNNNQILGYALIPVVNPNNPEVAQNVARPYIYDLAMDTFQFIPLFSSDADLFTDENSTFGGTARDINTSGQIVGWANEETEEGANVIRALLWDPTSPELSQDLGTLGGFSSQAYDINDNGIIVGVSDTDENFFRNQELAFVYDLSTEVMTQIPEFSTIAEFRDARAYSINNSNQIVGSAQVTASTGINAAFLYELGSESIINLNDMIDCSLGWDLVTARAINEDGAIVGTGTFDGGVRSFLLVPTADTTPTNCSQVDFSDDGEDSSSSSVGIFTLSVILLTWLRRRIIQ